mgnify:FL=1
MEDNGIKYLKKYLRTKKINANIIDKLRSRKNFYIETDYYFDKKNKTHNIKIIIEDNISYTIKTNMKNKKVWEGWSEGSKPTPLIAVFQDEYVTNLNNYAFEDLETMLSFIEISFDKDNYWSSAFACFFEKTDNINKFINIEPYLNYYIVLNNNENNDKIKLLYENNENVDVMVVKGFQTWNQALIKHKGVKSC